MQKSGKNCTCMLLVHRKKLEKSDSDLLAAFGAQYLQSREYQ
jgi:hypothetical protein